MEYMSEEDADKYIMLYFKVNEQYFKNIYGSSSNLIKPNHVQALPSGHDWESAECVGSVCARCTKCSQLAVLFRVDTVSLHWIESIEPCNLVLMRKALL